MAGGLEMNVDVSKATQLINKMKIILGDERGDKLTEAALKKAGRQVKKILKKDLPMKYRTKPSQVGKDVKSPISSAQSCVIPIIGTKYTVGGNHISASGGAAGWDSVRFRGKGYKITAQILKGKKSTLPTKMNRQGGNPPFRNTTAGSLHGAVFTRKSKERLPIASVSALATAQMPMNQAEPEVRRDIEEALYRSVEEYFYSHA